MFVKSIVAASLALVAASPALAQHPKSPKLVWKQQKPIGPNGLDGAPPSPMCRSSLGSEMHIHCLHNIVWHGGKRYFIDDLRDPNAKPVD